MKNLFSTSADFFKKVSETVCLFDGIWKEHTIALLLSPRENDKSSLIADIIDEATADCRQLLYVNTEHRADSLIERCSGNENLLFFTPAYDDPDAPEDYADLVFAGIERAVAETPIRTFIIDSVTRIAAMSFGKNASPAYIMKRLASLQARHNLSLLIIAHSSTKSADRALKNLSDCEVIALQTESSPESTPERRFPTCAEMESRFSTCANPDNETESRFPTCPQSQKQPRRNRRNRRRHNNLRQSDSV